METSEQDREAARRPLCAAWAADMTPEVQADATKYIAEAIAAARAQEREWCRRATCGFCFGGDDGEYRDGDGESGPGWWHSVEAGFLGIAPRLYRCTASAIRAGAPAEPPRDRPEAARLAKIIERVEYARGLSGEIGNTQPDTESKVWVLAHELAGALFVALHNLRRITQPERSAPAPSGKES